VCRPRGRARRGRPLRPQPAPAPTRSRAAVSSSYAWIHRRPATSSRSAAFKVRSLLSAIPSFWLYGGAAAIALCYASVAAVGAATYRALSSGARPPKDPILSMNPNSKALRAALLLAALIPLCTAAADPAKPTRPRRRRPPPRDRRRADTSAPTPTPCGVAAPEPKAPTTIIVSPRTTTTDDNRVSVSDSTYVGPGERVRATRSRCMGPVTVDGTVDGNAVSVMGRTRSTAPSTATPSSSSAR
jgi:hypothetical protein